MKSTASKIEQIREEAAMTLFNQSVMVKNDNLYLWTESFGNPADPTLLLIMGSGGQGILWPTEFCANLAKKGFFVIRYDNRDTGLSSLIDYNEQPYTLLDMATDAIDILNHYRCDKAHIVGASMGGAIAQLIGAHYPDRVQTLGLLMTTNDMRPAMDAFVGQTTQSPLSPPLPVVLNAARMAMLMPPNTLDEKVASFINNAKINSGGKKPVDEILCQQLALLSLARTRDESASFNHFKALMASHDLLSATQGQIKAPTFIMHGDADPIFPVDHAHALQATIKHAQLEIIPDVGHGLFNPLWFDFFINRLTPFFTPANA